MDDFVGRTYMVHDFGVASPVWYWRPELMQIADLQKRLENLVAERDALLARCLRAESLLAEGRK